MKKMIKTRNEIVKIYQKEFSKLENYYGILLSEKFILPTITELTAAQTIDKIIRIEHKIKEVRVGVRTDADNSLVASPNNFYAGLCLSEYK